MRLEAEAAAERRGAMEAAHKTVHLQLLLVGDGPAR